MTIIIALAHDEGVTLGSDQLWTAGQDMLKQDQVKWTLNPHGLSVGLSGSPYMAEAIGALGANWDDPLAFCDMLRDYFRQDDRWLPEIRKEGSPPTWDLNLILSDGRDVWEVGAVLYPLKYDLGNPVAMGSGYQYALGAMYVRQKIVFVGHEKTVTWGTLIVESGLAAAIHYDTSCGGDPWVATITKKEKP